MALVSDGYEITIGLIDVGRKRITKGPFQLRATDPEDVATAVTEILSDLNGATDLAITGYRVTEQFIEDDLTVPTSANADAENIARLVLQLATSPLKTAILEIPGPPTSFFGAAGTTAYDEVIISPNVLMNNWVDNFKASGTMTLSDGEDVAATNAVIKGRRVHRKTTISNPG